MANRYFRFLPVLLVVAVLCGGGLVAAMAAEPAEVAATPNEHVVEKEKGVPLKPDVLFHIGKFAITNSMFVTWLVAAAIIAFAQTATRNIQPGPWHKTEPMGVDSRKPLQFPRERDWERTR
jgi:hypothetical protein